MASSRKIKSIRNTLRDADRKKKQAVEAAMRVRTKDSTKLTKQEPPPENNPIEKAVRRATERDSQSALAWFYAEIKGELGADGRAKSRIRRIPNKAFDPSKDPFIGGMFFYVYDAKHKDTLPYWDKFPLTIPIKMYDDGFLGLNLHYLPPVGRAKLLDLLAKYKRRAATPKAYMKLSYELLNKAAGLEMFKPCLHRYLTNHIRSNLVKVSDEYWARAAILPVQKFEKKSAQEVWKLSANKIKRSSRKKK